MTTSTVSDRVQRGAALLDSQFPGWIDQVNLSTLNLSSGCDCILGQQFGDFMIGSRRTGLSIETASVSLGSVSRAKLQEHGFLVNLRDDEMRQIPGTSMQAPRFGAMQRMENEYVALTDEWAKLITDRRAQEQLAGVQESELIEA